MNAVTLFFTLLFVLRLSCAAVAKSEPRQLNLHTRAAEQLEVRDAPLRIGILEASLETNLESPIGLNLPPSQETSLYRRSPGNFMSCLNRIRKMNGRGTRRENPLPSSSDGRQDNPEMRAGGSQQVAPVQHQGGSTGARQSNVQMNQAQGDRVHDNNLYLANMHDNSLYELHPEGQRRERVVSDYFKLFAFRERFNGMTESEQLKFLGKPDNWKKLREITEKDKEAVTVHFHRGLKEALIQYLEEDASLIDAAEQRDKETSEKEKLALNKTLKSLLRKSRRPDRQFIHEYLIRFLKEQHKDLLQGGQQGTSNPPPRDSQASSASSTRHSPRT